MEREHAKYEFVRYTRGHGLDLGDGPTKAVPHALGVRETGSEHAKAPMVPDRLDELASVMPGSCDFIVATHVLCRDGERASGMAALARLLTWLGCLKDGGHLCLYEPSAEKLTPNDIDRLAFMASAHVGVTVVECMLWPAGGTLAVLRKGGDGIDYAYRRARPDKTACVVRHGGIGDQMQAAYLLPQLKRDGYHVTFLTTPKGQGILERDPHVDEWFIVDHDQVPNAELAAFWKTIARRYDKFVNLNESVEGTFLPTPGRAAHAWPHALRHKMLNWNYAEFAAELAEIPFVPEGRFYATPEERYWSDAYLTGLQRAWQPDWAIGMRSEPVYTVMWVLAGSSPHKFTPHQDAVITAILRRLARAVIIMVGDEVSRILESGWEDHPRVRCESGKLSVRQTLALAQRMNLVIGPETGVLNAVCYEPDVAKVLMLSHSSHENLSKHWLNTTPIAGIAKCYPCHQLHATSEFCDLEELNHTARCQAQVHPETLYKPIDSDYTGWARVQMLRSAA